MLRARVHERHALHRERVSERSAPLLSSPPRHHWWRHRIGPIDEGVRWLFHVVRAEDVARIGDGNHDRRYRAASLETEGFVHASYRDAVRESAQLYFPADADLSVLAIDPRRLDVPVDVAATPRGPMPHIRGSDPLDAVQVLTLGGLCPRG